MARATFFVIGKQAEQHPEIIRLRGRGYRCLTLSELLTEGPVTRPHATLLSRLWDGYEWAWNAWYGVERLGQDTILTLGPAVHHGPGLVLRDGTTIPAGTPVGELHLDRARVADLHRTMTRQAVGLAFRRELERSLQRLARMIVEQARYHQLKAFRCTTLFWRAATRLGFEVCARDIGWHQRFLGWYQRRLLVRDHPLGIRRL